MEEDGLVQELRAAGRPESQGRFTLDLAHALEKLRQHRLQDPHEYILALLSAAVRSGATLFDVTPRNGELAIQFDGEPFRRVELEGLFSHLLGGRARPAVLELAAGVHAALALNPASLQVESGGHRLTIAGGEEDLEETSSGHTCVHIRWHLDLRRWVGLPPELPILRRRGRHAPLRLSRGGEPLPQKPLDLGPCLAFHVVRHRGHLRWVEPPSGARSEQQGPVDAVLALGAAEDGLTVVMAGVSYEVPVFAGPWRAVVCSDELHPDLSRSGPVEDAAMQRLRAFLSAQFAEMLAAVEGEDYVPLARHLDEALPDKDPRRLPLLELAWRHAPEPELALRLARLYVQLDLPQQAKELFPTAIAGIHHAVRRTWATQPVVAVAQMDTAVALSREAFGHESAEWAEALAARGEVRALAGLEAAAREDAETALVLAHRHRDRPSAATARVLDSAALALRRDGRVEDALTLHREAQLVRSRSARPDRSRSLLYETTALLALGRPGEAFEALTPGFPEPPLLDVLAEACLRTEALPLAARVLVQGLEARRWPAMPRPEPEDHLFLAMVDEVLARKDPGDPALRRLARLRSGSGLLLPVGPAEVFEFIATAHEYAGYGSLDLAVNTLRRATHRLEDDGSPLHRALLAWQIALLRRLGRPAEADLVWARLQLLTAWAAETPAS